MWKTEFFSQNAAKTSPTQEKHKALLSCYEHWLRREVELLIGDSTKGAEQNDEHNVGGNGKQTPEEVDIRNIGNWQRRKLTVIDGFAGCGRYGTPSALLSLTTEEPPKERDLSKKAVDAEGGCQGDAGSPLLLLEGLRRFLHELQDDEEGRGGTMQLQLPFPCSLLLDVDFFFVEKRSENFEALCGHVNDWCDHHHTSDEKDPIPNKKMASTGSPIRKCEEHQRCIDLSIGNDGAAGTVNVTVLILNTSFADFVARSSDYADNRTRTCSVGGRFLFVDPYGCDGVSCADITSALLGFSASTAPVVDSAPPAAPTRLLEQTQPPPDSCTSAAAGGGGARDVGHLNHTPTPPSNHQQCNNHQLVMHMATTSMHRKAISKNGAGEKQGRKMAAMLGGSERWDALRTAALQHPTDPLKGHAAVVKTWLAAVEASVVKGSATTATRSCSQLLQTSSAVTTKTTELRGGNTHMVDISLTVVGVPRDNKVSS